MIDTAFRQMISADATPEQIKSFLDAHSFPLVQDSVVTFVYEGEADNVDLRHWIYGLPSSLALSRLGNTNLWHHSMEFPEQSRIEYKFGVSKGGHDEWVHDRLNPKVAHDPFGGNSVVHCSGYEVPEWSFESSDSAKGQIASLLIASETFGDLRTVHVYMPSNFRDYRRYRLLLVHDGDDYLRYSNLQHVLDNLIERLEIPPLIVAFTNPLDRIKEYANDPRHAKHIVEEVIPKLETKFPLINEPSGRCMMGASFGAVASLSTAWRYPGVFGSLLLQSGSFAFTDIGDHNRSPVFDPVVEFMNAFRKKPGAFAERAFVSCGVYESLIYENRSLVPFLQNRGLDVKYSESFDGHNWENWRDRLRDGLTWLFPGPLWVTYM